IVLVSACSREQPKPEQPGAAKAPPVGAQDWPAFTSAFIESRFKADPSFAVQSGRHEFDGQMPDWSRAGIEADVAQLRATLDDLHRFAPADLPPAQRFERAYMEWVIDTQIFWEASAEFPFRNPAWYIDKLDPSMYLTRDYAPLEKRLQGFLGYLRAVPRLASDIRSNLRTPLPRAFIEHGILGFGGYASFFRTDVPPIFASVADENLKRELAEASGSAARAMDELSGWLESQRGAATDDFALGAEKLSEMLRVTERVALPSEELELVGRKDLERNRAALVAACAAFAPGVGLAACVDRM